jgi:hypothetical protein
MEKTRKYEIVRFFRNGLKPVLIQGNLSQDEALAISRINNSQTETGSIWFDAVRREALR